MSFLIFIILGQVVAVALVILVLKFVLNSMLIDLAVKHIEVWKLSEAKNVDRILILSHKPLKKVYIDRINRAVKSIFSSNVFIDFQIQKSLLGGAVVHAGGQVIDCSLKDRLSKAIQMR